MAPESISRLADCRPAPSTVSGAQPTRTPAGRAPGRAARAAAADVERQRLLAPHVLARRDRGRGHLGVRGGDGQVHDQLHAGMVERVARAARSPARRRRPPAPWPGPVSMSAQNSTATSGNAARFAQVLVADVAAADDADAERLRARTRPAHGPARPGRQPARGQPGEAVADGGEHVGRAAVELDHVPLGGRAGGEDLGDRHPAAADRGHRVVPGDRAVLHVQVAHPVAEAAEQRGHVLPADRRPVGVDLEDHRRVERVREHLEAGPAADERRQLEVVVVVAEPQPLVRGLGGGLVELASERGDRVGVGEPLRAAPTARSPCPRRPPWRRAAARRRLRRGPRRARSTRPGRPRRGRRAARSGSVRTS